MNHFPTRILLATDGSEDAALARRAAVDISGSTGSELHLIHVWRATPAYAHPAIALATDSEYYEQRAQELLMEQKRLPHLPRSSTSLLGAPGRSNDSCWAASPRGWSASPRGPHS